MNCRVWILPQNPENLPLNPETYTNYTCSRNNNTVHELLRKPLPIVTTISWINTKRVGVSQRQRRAPAIFENPGPTSEASSAISAINLSFFRKKSFHDCKQFIADEALLVGPGFSNIADALRCRLTSTVLS